MPKVRVYFDVPKMSASVDRCVSPLAEPCSFFLTVAALDKLHAKHVLPGFADRSSEEREIEAATSDITKVKQNCLIFISVETSSALSHLVGLPSMSGPNPAHRRHLSTS